MKKEWNVLLFVFLMTIINAQEKPFQASYKDFGFKKQPKTVTKIHYEFIDKIAIDQAKEIWEFNAEGNITSYTEISYLDNNETTQKTYTYENGLLIKERKELSAKKHLQSTTTYEYNSDRQLVKKVYKTDDGLVERYYYDYKNGKQIQQSKVAFKGGITIKGDHLYNKEGTLYQINFEENTHLKKIYRWKESYLNGFKIFELDDDRKSSFIYTDDEGIAMQYTVNGDQLYSDLENLQKILAKNEFDATDEFHEILYANFKNPEQMVLNRAEIHKRNDNRDLIATAEIFKFDGSPIENIGFQEIIYADGSKSGTTDFDFFIYKSMNKLVEKKE